MILLSLILFTKEKIKKIMKERKDTAFILGHLAAG
jgi:hypothetical protein